MACPDFFGAPSARGAALFLNAVVSLSVWTGAQAAAPAAPGDFAKLAARGFTEVVDGTFFAGAGYRDFPNLVPDPTGEGQTRNTYAWSGAPSPAGDGSFYIGTNVDAVCIGLGGTDCDVGGGAQIWKYTPSEDLVTPGPDPNDDWGLSGHWTPVFLSPLAVDERYSYDFNSGLFPNGATLAQWIALLNDGTIRLFLEIAGFDLEMIELRIDAIEAALPGGTLYDFPRDVGYRNMALCDVDGPGGDQPERLYVATAGLPGLILWLDTTGATGVAETFSKASTLGLNANVVAAAVEEGTLLDIGYRALTCVPGFGLVTAQAGSASDPDAPTTPAVLINQDPTNPESPWVQLVDLSDPSTSDGLGKPTNQGAFQAETVGSYLYVSVGNRTEGFDLWRGDFGACTLITDALAADCVAWTRIIEQGGGRPADLLTQAANDDPDFVPSPGATLGVFGNALYVAASESGFAARSIAELFRVNNAHTASPTWELLVGWPRRDWGSGNPVKPGTFDCAVTADMADGIDDVGSDPGQLSAHDALTWRAVLDGLGFDADAGDEIIPLDPDGAADDCLPTTGAGPGWGTDLQLSAADVAALPGGEPPVSAYSFGPYQYFWRMAEYDDPATGSGPDQLYLGLLDIGLPIPADADIDLPAADAEDGYLPPGFDLMRTANGEDFHFVTRDAFGEDAVSVSVGSVSVSTVADVGVRTLFQAPSLGLVVGSGTISADVGTSVWIGTRNPEGFVPPVADAGDDQLLFSGGAIAATLNAGRSVSSFDGGTDLTCQWYQGAAAADCSGLSGAAVGASSPCDAGVPTSPLTPAGGAGTPYPFTVQVTQTLAGGGSLSACDSVTVNVSSNEAPSARLFSSVPLTDPAELPPFAVPSGGENTAEQHPFARLVDFDGDGEETYQVRGICDDVDNDLSVCAFEVADSVGNTISKQSVHCENGQALPTSGPCVVTAAITTMTPQAIADALGDPAASFDPTPEVVLVVEDVHRATRVQWSSAVAEVADSTANDAPVCRSVVQRTNPDLSLDFDPTTGLLDGNPACVDADATPLTFSVVPNGPFQPGATATGSSTTTLSYNPGAGPVVGDVDKFELEAEDSNGGGTSSNTAVLVQIGAPLDVDGDGVVSLLSDGLMIARKMLGYQGDNITSGLAIGSSCARCSAAAIEPYIEELAGKGVTDVDNNGKSELLSDGLIILRKIIGYTGTNLTSGLSIPGSCSRCGTDEIEGFLDQML
jgi:hypothetical protein